MFKKYIKNIIKIKKYFLQYVFLHKNIMYSKTECVGVWSDGQRVARWSGSQYAVFKLCGKSC